MPELRSLLLTDLLQFSGFLTLFRVRGVVGEHLRLGEGSAATAEGAGAQVLDDIATATGQRQHACSNLHR